jgi:hypothetical protein
MTRWTRLWWWVEDRWDDLVDWYIGLNQPLWMVQLKIISTLVLVASVDVVLFLTALWHCR